MLPCPTSWISMRSAAATADLRCRIRRMCAKGADFTMSLNDTPRDDSGRMPTPEEVQRELEQFLKQQTGENTAKADLDSLGTKETETQPKDDAPSIETNLIPAELERYLRQFVVRQEEAVEVLATKIATHFRRMQWEQDEGKGEKRIPGLIKPNILMIGPTGVGKTYIVKLIAERMGVPFVKGDATKFSETGYVGGDVEDLVRDLVRAAKGNIAEAEHGIIYIDEIDKIAASGGLNGPDVSRTGVQRNLLKLMEETEVELRVPHDLAGQMEAVIETQKSGKAPQKKVNTRNILFIVSGAFGGLEDIIRKRLNRKPMGFGSDVEISERSVDDILGEVTTNDLIEYGFESEFIGRLPVLVQLQDLDVDGLYEVLTNEYNAVVQGKIRDFKAYGIKLHFSEEALLEIAKRAHKEKTGARGLTRVVEKALMPFEKRLPSTTLREFTFSAEMMENPRAACEELVTGGSIRQAVEAFQDETGVALEVSPNARRWLTEHARDEQTPGDVLLTTLKDFHYAFNLLKRDNMNVTPALLEAPNEYMEDLIKQSYKEEKD
ncbi:AAA domain-containing protein [bacterium]|nr:AAA domain-containing protein [bacterium]